MKKKTIIFSVIAIIIVAIIVATALILSNNQNTKNNNGPSSDIVNNADWDDKINFSPENNSQTVFEEKIIQSIQDKPAVQIISTGNGNIEGYLLTETFGNSLFDGREYSGWAYTKNTNDTKNVMQTMIMINEKLPETKEEKLQEIKDLIDITAKLFNTKPSLIYVIEDITNTTDFDIVSIEDITKIPDTEYNKLLNDGRIMVDYEATSINIVSSFGFIDGMLFYTTNASVSNELMESVQ